jgi:acetyltransferase-like isoleucine patch superfamily enzyme
VAGGVVIGQGAKLGNHTFYLYDSVIGRVTLGDYSYVNERSLVLSGCIGKFCSIAPDCKIGLEEHPRDCHLPHLAFTVTTIFENPTILGRNTAPPIIGSDV